MSYGIPAIPSLPVQGGGLAPMELPKRVIRIGEQALWSSFRYTNGQAVASTQNRLFAAPRGQVAQGFAAPLSIAETNLKEGGRVPGGYAYDVYAMACEAFYINNRAIVSADLGNVLHHSVLLWDFLQTQVEVAPVSLIGAAGGIFGSTADTGGVEGGAGGSRIALNNGNGSLWVYRSHPVVLPANATFSILHVWGANGAVIDGGPGNSDMQVRVDLLGRFQTAIAIG